MSDVILLSEASGIDQAPSLHDLLGSEKFYPSL